MLGLGRDLLVSSVGAILRLTAGTASLHAIGTTSVPLQKNLGGTCLSGPCVGTQDGPGSLHRPGTTSVPLRKNPGPSAKMPEGPACQVRISERWRVTSFPRLFGGLGQKIGKNCSSTGKASPFSAPPVGNAFSDPSLVPSFTRERNNAKGSPWPYRFRKSLSEKSEI